MRRGGKTKQSGGLQILGREDRRVEWTKVDTGEIRDLLVIEGKCFGMRIRIILVYFDSDKKIGSQEAKDNKKLKAEVERMIECYKMEGLIILGDMNAHLEMLEGRKEDINGKMIKEWMEDRDLILLNGDEKCEGTYTWGRFVGEKREQRSATSCRSSNGRLRTAGQP